MNEYHDTLIRIETNTNNMLRDIKEMKEDIKNQPCRVNSHKIGRLEKIVYGAVVLVLLAFMSNLTSTNIKAEQIEKDKCEEIHTKKDKK